MSPAVEALITFVLAVIVTVIVFKFVPDILTAVFVLIVFVIAYAVIRPRVGRSL